MFNAAFKPVELKDEKGSHIMNAYDALNRPIKVWAIDNTGENFKQLLSVFSGSAPFTCYRVQWDPGGVCFATYAALLLDSAIHQTTTEYDALNRATQITYPEDYNSTSVVLQPMYNLAGALEKVVVDGTTTYVEHIAYNAKGQRILIAFNTVMTRYAYDNQTFRLKRIRSEAYTHTPGSWEFESAGSVRQDTVYSYDLAGNIVGTTEKRTGCGIGGSDLLQRNFDYDALYRLCSDFQSSAPSKLNSSLS